MRFKNRAKRYPVKSHNAFCPSTPRASTLVTSIHTRVRHTVLLPNSQKQAITHIAQPGLQHALARQLLVDGGKPDIDALSPLGGGPLDARLGAQDAQDDDALGAPLAQGLDGGGTGAASGDDGVEDDGQGR